MPSIVIPDRLQRGHRAENEDAHAIGDRWAQTFERLGGLRAGMSVLDIGCGPGRMTIAIGDRFDWNNDYIGFEIKKNDVNFLKEEIEPLHPNFRFFHIDVVNGRYNPSGRVLGHEVVFPASNESVDFAFATSVFTHMHHDETLRYVQETARVLRKGGTFLSTWAILDETSEAQIKAGSARANFAHSMPDGTRINVLTDPAKSVAHQLESVQAMFEGAGLSFELHRGAWTGLPGPHGQDIVLGRKRS